MTTVYVGNLDANATTHDLRKAFDRYGKITDIWVAQKPPGFAFVDFEDEKDAKGEVLKRKLLL